MAQNILFQDSSYVPVPANSNELNFQQFSYGNQQDYSQPPPQFNPSSSSGGALRNDLGEGVTWASIKRAFSTGGYDNEPPLLEGT